jgi:CRISPR-associated protein Cmr2
MNQKRWKTKLAAWLHDPAEKSLILMRTAEGHEKGTAAQLKQAIGGRLGIDLDGFDKRADWLASAADRPNWPRPDDEVRYPGWERVRFTSDPVLIHPLSGEPIELKPLAADIGAGAAKTVSFDHFERLVQDDARKTFLAFWRFGPELGRWAPELGALWNVLPADSRTPDHSIWSHVDTVSALATALADGDQPALLAMSFGPVQSFIAQARSTSDLWASSHLLSSLVWAAMKTVVEDIGPDSVVFPALRGVPAVDAWLLETLGDSGYRLFEGLGAEFIKDKTDTNPLFSAALPNKFVAVVPARRARELAERATAAAKTRAQEIAEQAAERVFDAAGVALPETTSEQIARQMSEFPEAFWASATWPVQSDVKNIDEAASQLQDALAAIHPDLAKQGIFDDRIWPVLTRKLDLDGFAFWQPNAGVFYPAVYELAERSLAAAKSVRPFDPLPQEGFRCTQCGEREWVTDDRALLGKNRTERKNLSVWGKLADRKRSWAKAGEHLCAVCTSKRLWPTLFAKEVGEIVGEQIDRFVISTHALAVSTSVELNLDAARQSPEKASALMTLESTLNALNLESATLPKRLMRQLKDASMRTVAKKLPSLLELVRNEEDLDERIADTGIRLREVDGLVKTLFGKRPETYYALIQMDGDRMGGWLAGNEDDYKLSYRETWHRQVQVKVDGFAGGKADLKAFIDTKRPPSPARHAAISRALNDFSIHLARHVIEDCCKGKLLYAGGDDVLALVAVDDLFDAMLLLRLAYSGIEPHQNMNLQDHIGELRPGGSGRQTSLLLKDGFGLLNGRFMTLMGHKATASLGAVVAHHSAPLSLVLRQLREAESRAKSAGRDRFCIRVLKRGGGEVSVISPWWKTDGAQLHIECNGLQLMKQLRDELAETGFSRGAIYRAQLWFEGLTDDKADAAEPGSRWREQMAGALAAQFTRQKGSAELAHEIVDYVCDVIRPDHPKTALENFLATAEFFARESRSCSHRPPGEGPGVRANRAEEATV